MNYHKSDIYTIKTNKSGYRLILVQDTFYQQDKLTSLTAKNGTDTLAAVFATETGIALAMTEKTLALAATTIWTVVRHILGNYGDE